MGVVYRARDTRLGRAVALKVLSEDSRDRPPQALPPGGAGGGAVTHPAIAQIYDVGEGPEGLFIAMELVEGKTVKALIQGRELDLLGALEIAHPGRGRPAEGPRARHRPPRHQARERDRDARTATRRSSTSASPSCSSRRRRRPRASRHMETLAKTQAGFVARHAALHEPRAGPRPGRRPPQRHLLARHRALRDGDRAAALLRHDRRSTPCTRSRSRRRGR